MRPPAGPAGGAGAIRIARRTLLKSTGAALLAPALSSAQALQPAGNALRACRLSRELPPATVGGLVPQARQGRTRHPGGVDRARDAAVARRARCRAAGAGLRPVSAPRGLVEVEWSGLKWPGLKAQVSVPPGARARLPDGREVGPGKHAFALAAA
jgi:hypothetical protein